MHLKICPVPGTRYCVSRAQSCAVRRYALVGHTGGHFTRTPFAGPFGLLALEGKMI